MVEKSNIELIKEFAKTTNRSIVAKEIPYPVTGIGTFQKYKRMISVPNNSNNTSYYVWFSDPYAKIGLPTIYCGAFIPLPSRINSKINIRNKNALDKFNIFSKNKTNIIGNDRFDSKVIISGNFDTAVKRLLSKTRIQEQLLKGLEIDTFMMISLNENNIEFIPEFMNKSYLSIINPHSWEFERRKIETMYSLVEKIRANITEGSLI